MRRGVPHCTRQLPRNAWQRLLAAMGAASLVWASAAPSPAWAGPVEESAELAQKGAAAFKNKQYYEAATAFMQAYQFDKRDPKNLRYAGRAWQEIGHWQRALNLLERYVEVEPDEALRTSIVDKLEPLRKATPQQILDALLDATKRFPEAQLEEEAALALEKIGDEAALKKAEKFYEVARLGAVQPNDRERIEAGLKRVQSRLVEVQKQGQATAWNGWNLPTPALPPPAGVQPGAGQAGGARAGTGQASSAAPGDGAAAPIGIAKPAPRSSTAAWVLSGVGGALAAGGAAALFLGMNKGTQANADAKNGVYGTGDNGYDAYLTDKNTADLLYWGGIGGAVLGGGLLITGIVVGASGPSQSPGAAGPLGAGLILVPCATAHGPGLTLHVAF